MYHSYIVIDTGGNPDRPRPGRNLINNVYTLHQRLCMGFPNESKIIEDPFFLKPFDDTYFTFDGTKSEHYNELSINKRPKFLFRIDNQIYDNQKIAIIGIQSELEPNWEYAFANAQHLLSKDFPLAQPKLYQPKASNNDIFKFRIEINLSKKSNEYNSQGTKKDTKVKEKGQNKRVAFIWGKDEKNRSQIDPEIEIKKWFDNKIQRSNLGFETQKYELKKLGWRMGWKRGNDQAKANTLRFRSALLEGELKVTNEEQFLQTIQRGIGSAKAFGFGLLSVQKT